MKRQEPKRTASFLPWGCWRVGARNADLAGHALSGARFVVLDTETTGFSARKGDAIIALGVVAVEQGGILWETCWEQVVNPGRPVPPVVEELTGIKTEALADKPRLAEVAPEFLARARGDVLVGYNLAFDLSFLTRELGRAVVGQLPGLHLDVRDLAFMFFPAWAGSLDRLLLRLGLAGRYRRHSALGDALATAEILLRLLGQLEGYGITTLGGLLRWARQARRRVGLASLSAPL